MATDKKDISCDVVIIGSGPCAHTAAIYASRATLNTVLFEGVLATSGGQLMTTTDVENFPGFPEGILGSDLIDALTKQSKRFGTQIIGEQILEVDTSARPFRLRSPGYNVTAKSVIVATGATANKLTFEGSERLWNNGISACAVCDGAGPLFRKKPVAVVGGGDTAMEEAMFLSKYASQVFLVHRRDTFRASKIMQKRVLDNPKITVLWNTQVIKADGDPVLKTLTLRDTVTGAEREMEAGGLFYAIGHTPSSAFLNGQVQTDADGYIATKPGTTQTSVHGLFAAGDVQDRKYRQAITAAGSGCMAALEVVEYLMEIEDH